MTDPSSSAQPRWVHKRDGRLVPFDADRISRDLFAATETLGQGNAFLARELTDSVLYFLGLESEGTVPTTAQIAELIVKVVRELGHPELSAAFAFRETRATAKPPAAPPPPTGPSLADLQYALSTATHPADLAWYLSGACLRAYSLQAVFAPDLVAAHAEGLLQLGNLETPLELAGCILPPAAPNISLIERLSAARRQAGAFVVLDGPEFTLRERPDSENAVADFCRELRVGLETTGLRAVVNLNCDVPPPGTGELAEGPLFGAERQAPDAETCRAVADRLLEQLPSPRISIEWHLTPRDLADTPRLLRLARRVVEGAPVRFVFDRPRRPISLAEGIDRHNPATLFAIGLNLPRLVKQIGAPASGEAFLKKLGSLVRLAHSGATSKREFLRGRGRPELGQGFLLDRSRLVLIPLGLEAVVSQVVDRPVEAEGEGLVFAGQILATLRQAAQMESRNRHLEAIIESGSVPDTARSPRSLPEQLRIGAALATALPTVDLHLPHDAPVEPEAIIPLLRQAWQSEIVRLRIVPPVKDPHSAALWEE